jgi:hypothetical protein
MSRATKESGVRGHWCKGIEKYQETSEYHCIPSFNEVGETVGCDDTNTYKIEYCPFCGEKLVK